MPASSHRPSRLRSLATAALVVAAWLPAWSMAAESSAAEQQLRDQLRQTTLELRETQDENATLKARQAELSGQLAAQPAAPVVKKADDGRVAALQRTLQEQAARQQAMEQQLEDAQKTLAQWQQAYQQAAEVARARDAAANKYQAQYEQSNAAGESCVQKNAELVQISDELLQHYENKGVWESFRDQEPFTQLHRVKLEKLAQEYHDKVVNNTVPPVAAATAEGRP